MLEMICLAHCFPKVVHTCVWIDCYYFTRSSLRSGIRWQYLCLQGLHFRLLISVLLQNLFFLKQGSSCRPHGIDFMYTTTCKLLSDLLFKNVHNKLVLLRNSLGAPNHALMTLTSEFYNKLNNEHLVMTMILVTYCRVLGWVEGSEHCLTFYIILWQATLNMHPAGDHV